MKFKNYVNPHTKDNRIYSDKDILDMSVGNVFKKAKEILSQKRTIGIPNVNELKVSSNTIWIDEYTRDDGTRVCGHWRSKPERGRIDEFEPPKKSRTDYDSDGMSLSGGEVVDALKTVIGGGIEKVKEFGELLANLFDNVDVEVLKSLPDNLKELYVNLADKIGSGTMTGAAANVLEKLEETSDVVLEGGVEFVDYLSSSGEALKQIADKIQLPEVNAEVVNKVLSTAKDVWKESKNIILNDTIQEGIIKLDHHIIAENYPEQEYYKLAFDLKKAKLTGKIPKWILDHNNIEKIKNIKNKNLNNFVKNKILNSIDEKSNSVDINNVDDIYVIIPKSDSKIVNIIKKDSNFISNLKDNMKDIKAGKYINRATSYNFKSFDKNVFNDTLKNFSLHNTIGLCDLYDIKVESNGDITMYIVDYYDFAKSSSTYVNNAYKHQIKGKLENYLMLIPIIFKSNDI